MPDPSFDDPTPLGPSSRPAAPETEPATEFDEGPCMSCGQRPARMESYMWVTSFVFLTRHLEYSAALCRRCSTRTALKESLKSGLLGWWGIPWGLLTFQALWINFRTLWRWSTLPRAVGLLFVALALSVPFSVGYLLFQQTEEERAARKTGDWVDEATIRLVEKGHHLADAGNFEGALEAYLDAYAKAPRSSVVNYSVASAYIRLGRYEEARPFAARARKLAPEDLAAIAQEGWLSAVLDGPEAARATAEDLRGRRPADTAAAIALADLYQLLHMPEEQLAAADAGLALEPLSIWLLGRRLEALVELDRLEEAAALLEGLAPSQASDPIVEWGRDLYTLRAAETEGVERVLRRWAEESYTVGDMTRLVEVLGGFERLEPVQTRVRAWLHEEDTPPSAWWVARPWFDEESWPRELDRYLEHRPEVAPGLLRLALFDQVTESDEVRRLSGRLRVHEDHPLIASVDQYYFGIGLRREPLDERLAALGSHIEQDPHHTLCVFLAVALSARRNPTRASEWLARLDSKEDAALAAALAVEEAEISLAQGLPAAAEQRLAGVDPRAAADYRDPQQIELLKAEVSLHIGDTRRFQRRIEPLLSSADPSMHAAALVLRWTDQATRSEPLTYRADVEEFLSRHEAALPETWSGSALSIRVVEDRLSRAEGRRHLLEEQLGTLKLVDLYRQAGETGELDRDALRRVADSRFPLQYAPLLARRILDGPLRSKESPVSAVRRLR